MELEDVIVCRLCDAARGLGIVVGSFPALRDDQLPEDALDRYRDILSEQAARYLDEEYRQAQMGVMLGMTACKLKFGLRDSAAAEAEEAHTVALNDPAMPESVSEIIDEVLRLF